MKGVVWITEGTSLVRCAVQHLRSLSESEKRTIFSSQSKGKRDRDAKVVHSLKREKILKQILERKVDSAVRGELMAQQKMYEAEVELEARN